MVKIWPYFHSPFELQFLFVFKKNCPKNIFFEIFRWGIILLDFMSFSFRTCKSKNDISYIKYQFSHRFGKVYRWLNMYYSNTKILIFLKITIMSMWIISKNLVWTYRECIFATFEPPYCAFTLSVNVHIVEEKKEVTTKMNLHLVKIYALMFIGKEMCHCC